MTATTFDAIEARAARFHAAEGERNAPTPAAIRAVYSLVSALRDLDDADYDHVVELLHAELAVLNAPAD